MQLKTIKFEKSIWIIREVNLHPRNEKRSWRVWQRALTSEVFVVLQNCVLCWCSVLLSERTFSHCCDSVPLPLCWWHCRDWHQAERCGKYVSRGASICHPRALPRVVTWCHIWGSHSRPCSRGSDCLPLCAVYWLIHTVFEKSESRNSEASVGVEVDVSSLVDPNAMTFL